MQGSTLKEINYPFELRSGRIVVQVGGFTCEITETHDNLLIVEMYDNPIGTRTRMICSEQELSPTIERLNRAIHILTSGKDPDSESED